MSSGGERGSGRRHHECDERQGPSDVAAVVGMRYVAAPHRNRSVLLAHDPASPIPVGNRARHVIHDSRDHRYVVTVLRPFARHFVESRSAGPAGKQVVLMNDEDLHDVMTGAALSTSKRSSIVFTSLATVED